MKTLIAAIAMTLALAAPALAQTPPPAEGTVVEGLVVTSLDHGPAWWKVTKGESTVFIMGAPMAMMPRNLDWDTKVLERRLKGANALITPSRAQIGLGDLFGLLKLRKDLKADEAMETMLPEPLRVRFVAARTSLKKDEARYAKWTPVLAGGMLQGDYADANKLRNNGAIWGEVGRLARRYNVPNQSRRYKGMPMLKSIVGQMSDEEKSNICMAGYLEAVEQDPDRYRKAAQGWATGDVGAAIDVPRGPDVCNAVFTDDFVKTQITDQVDAIAEALETPGKAVGFVPLRQMVVKDGVIEQLRARGFTVIDPASKQGDEE